MGESFVVLPSEDQSQFKQVLNSLRHEHRPSTLTEAVLVENMAQSYWLTQSGIALENACLADPELSPADADARLDEAARSQRAEDRKAEHHKWDMLLAEAKLDHQNLQNMTLRHPMELAAAIEKDRLKAKASF